MNDRLGVLLLGSVLPLTAATPAHGQANWSTLAPQDEGFSIEVPGESHATKESGHYVYGDDDHAYIIKVDPVSAEIREFVTTRAREPVDWFLQRIARGLTNGGKHTLLYSSSEDYDGYPSLLIAHEGEEQNTAMEGLDRLVLTEDHLYLLITVRRPGASKADAEHFLDSFHLVKPRPAPAPGETTAATPPAASPLVTTLSGPMLAVARLIVEEQLSPGIDQFVQKVPAGERLGAQWTSSNAAWQRARAVVVDRIGNLFEMYEATGELVRLLESEVAGHPSADVEALTAVLNGPSGGAIVRNCAAIHFVSTVMASDPNGPKAGERAWGEKMRALNRKLNERAGATMPVDDGTHAFEVSRYLATPAHELAMDLWHSVVGKVTSQITGAANLMMFDDHERIMRDIEVAVASPK